MMIKPDASADSYWVGGELYKASVIVTPDKIIDNWRVASAALLAEADFQYFASFDPEIFILGSGTHILMPDPSLLAPLIDQKCGYEVMTSRSACSTFNILLAEARKVVVALM